MNQDSDKIVETVRRFNRFYTRQIGVLQERLLQSPFSLTEVRVLYELANRPNITAAELRKDLGLDAGYLSRMLRRFQEQGLLEKSASQSDGRQHLLLLTAKGRIAFTTLNRKSDKEVAKLLIPLSPPDQKTLINAMQSIESILGNKPSGLCEEPYILREPRPGDMGWVVHRHGVLYSNEWGYDMRFEALVASIVGEFVRNCDAQRERCWIAEREGEIVGSVFLVKKSNTVAKLRLLLVEPSARGLGLGKRLVQECVTFSLNAGYRKIILWTQSELSTARHIYQQAGFSIVGEERHSSWGRRQLVSEVWEKKL